MVSTPPNAVSEHRVEFVPEHVGVAVRAVFELYLLRRTAF